MTINDKLNLLREKTKEKDIDIAEFIKVINDWQKEIEKQELLNDYRQHDMSKQICELLISISIAITRKLITENDKDLRIGLQSDLGRCKWLLNIYSNNPEENLKLIENTIDEELERLGI